MGGMRNAYKITAVKLKRKHLRDPDIGQVITLKWIIKKQGMRL
jgi:hypothetical protein